MDPTLYHAHHSRHIEDLPFWQWLAKNHPGPLLELGCGTGRVLLSLVKSGQLMVGLDNDHAMLSFFMKQLTPPERANVHLIQADFTQYNLVSKFKLIILPCNTLSTLSMEQIHKVLTCARLHLDSSGIFAASLPNTHLLERLPSSSEVEEEEVFPHPLDGEPVHVSSSWHRAENTFTVSWYYDHLLQDGKVERLHISAHHKLTTMDQYLQAFHQAGFKQVTCYGDFHRRKYRNSSLNFIFVAAVDNNLI